MATRPDLPVDVFAAPDASLEVVLLADQEYAEDSECGSGGRTGTRKSHPPRLNNNHVMYFRSPQARSVPHVAVRLAALQGIGWLAVEFVERAASGEVPVARRALVPVVVGLAVQAVIAVVGALLLALLGAVADRLFACQRQRRPCPPARQWPMPTGTEGWTRVAACAWSERGPPAPGAVLVS